MQFLESEGYTNYYAIINAKDQGIPQNRERVFTVSIIGEHDIYHFPVPIPLELRLKDLLEDEVDDKYVLSDQAIQGFLKHNENHKAKGTGFLWIPKDVDNVGGGTIVSPTASEQILLSMQLTIPSGKPDIANCIRSSSCICPTDNTIMEYVKESDSA